MKNNKYVLVLLLCMAGLFNAYAQDKLAYIDENYVVSQLPEYKTIQEEMNAYETRVKGELDKMNEEYQTKLKDVQEKSQDPNTAQVILQAKVKELQDLEQQIVEMQRNIQQEYQAELGKKLQPVYEKMQKAVDDVSAANGNAFIFRIEALYYQEEANNLSDAVLKKLGVTPTETVSGRGNLKSSNKIGVFDVNKGLPQLPEFKAAEKEIETYTAKLQEGIQKIQQEIQQVASIVEREGDTMPEARRQELGKQYQAKQQELQKAQQAAQDQLGKKRNDLLEPIYKKLQDNINAVAKAQGYSYILKIESSLYEPEANNITNAVLTKLGVTPQE